MKIYCFFCGQALTNKDNPTTFICLGCRAVFSAQRDDSGCVIQMEVQGCGTPDCCRQKKAHS